MKILKLLFISLAILFLGSCVRQEIVYHNSIIEDNPFSLYELVESYDLWYVDIHSTTGTAEVPFLQRAFTVTFNNGRMYGNNNIVDIGKTGDGYGIKIGRFGTYDNILETSHRDGDSDFEVKQISANKIRLYDVNQNVSYVLVGYMIDDFNYDELFYENIEYFLQEYAAWERIDIKDGVSNIFDEEHYLMFTEEDDNTFSSSGDYFGITIDSILWDYVGSYEIANYDNSDVKRLTFYYDNNDTEVFDLYVIEDDLIRLEHLATKTIYDFKGIGFIQYLRSSKGETPKKKTRNSDRKRRKITRKSITYK